MLALMTAEATPTRNPSVQTVQVVTEGNDVITSFPVARIPMGGG